MEKGIPINELETILHSTQLPEYAVPTNAAIFHRTLNENSETIMGKIKKGEFRYSERKQDLFTMGKQYVLAHCVSTDCALGAGIALEFRKRIPEMPDSLKVLNPDVGDAIRYDTRGGRVVVNLFTKERAFHKPTLESLTASLISFRSVIREQGYTHVAIPEIGCGLDKLKWFEVRDRIQEVFKDDELEIVVCSIG